MSDLDSTEAQNNNTVVIFHWFETLEECSFGIVFYFFIEFLAREWRNTIEEWKAWSWYFVWHRLNSTILFKYSDGVSALFNYDWSYRINTFYSNPSSVHERRWSSTWFNYFNDDFCYGHRNFYSIYIWMPFTNRSSIHNSISFECAQNYLLTQ